MLALLVVMARFYFEWVSKSIAGEGILNACLRGQAVTQYSITGKGLMRHAHKSVARAAIELSPALKAGLDSAPFNRRSRYVTVNRDS